MEANLEKIQEIFRDVFDDDELIVTLNTVQDDLEDWDSFAQLNLVMAIEKEFDIKLRVNEIANIKSVNDIMKVIENNKG